MAYADVKLGTIDTPIALGNIALQMYNLVSGDTSRMEQANAQGGVIGWVTPDYDKIHMAWNAIRYVAFQLLYEVGDTHAPANAPKALVDGMQVYYFVNTEYTGEFSLTVEDAAGDGYTLTADGMKAEYEGVLFLDGGKAWGGAQFDVAVFARPAFKRITWLTENSLTFLTVSPAYPDVPLYILNGVVQQGESSKKDLRLHTAESLNITWAGAGAVVAVEDPRITNRLGEINEATLTNYQHTDYIDLSDYASKNALITYLNEVRTNPQADLLTGLCFYDAGKVAISGVPFKGDAQEAGTEENTVSVPANAAFVRFSIRNEHVDQFTASVEYYESEYVRLLTRQTILQPWGANANSEYGGDFNDDFGPEFNPDFATQDIIAGGDPEVTIMTVTDGVPSVERVLVHDIDDLQDLNELLGEPLLSWMPECKGCALRWLNAQGGVDGFVFSPRSRVQRKAKTAGYVNLYNPDPYNVKDTVNVYDIDAEDLIILGVENLPKKQYEVLRWLPLSRDIVIYRPDVSVPGNRWQSVTVEDYNVEDSVDQNAVDFEITIRLPKLNLQV